MENRQAKTDIYVGINGTGKTSLLKEVITQMNKQGHRILIVTPDSLEWREVPTISYRLKHHIKTYTGMRRIVYYDDCLSDVQKYFSNGVLVLDDARDYIQAQTDSVMRWLKLRRRQAGIDLFSVFHGLSQVPPEFFTFTSQMWLFYTTDNLKRRSDCLEEHIYNEIQNAKQDILKEVNEGNMYARRLISLDKRFEINNK
ncbi:MAG: ATP-binding protein [Bacteroidales bacterium]|jgi:hypothetical protein|nr:ATP-binding protein [Bacteroidales bacterium]